MGITAKAKAAYEKYQKYKKAKDKYDAAKGHFETIKKILDEDTRSEEIFKLGLKGMTKLGEKVAGSALTKHPYFTYHKAHLEALGAALTASSTHENALRNLHSAIASADSAAALAAQLADFETRKKVLRFHYFQFLSDSVEMVREHGTASGIALVAPVAASVVALVDNPLAPRQALRAATAAQLAAQANVAQAAKKIRQDTGGSPEQLRAQVQAGLYTWRASWCDLYFDTADLFVMVDLEYRAASAAYKRYQQKVQRLQKSSKSIDRVAGLGAEKKRQEEWALRVSRGNAPEAVVDPSAYARRQRDAVAEAVKKLATICDVVMSEQVYDPKAINAKIGSL